MTALARERETWPRPPMAAFVDSVLSSSCRPKEHEKAVSSKLRGKRLLLENVRTVAPGEVSSKRRRRPAKQPSPPAANRARRRALLLEAVAQVTYEQLLPQHTAWLAYAEAELRAAPAAEPLAVLARLDWHGARVRVAQSASAAHANCHGLVLSETRRMLLLLNDSRRAWVPKAGTTVEITLPGSTALCEAARPDP